MFVSSVAVGLALLPAAFAVVHDVQVGANGLTFSPEAIYADPGDQVVFHFMAKNHTVTESSFAHPCGRREGTHIDSGFVPVPANTTTFPTYTIDVTSHDPIWIYCAQAAGTPNSHCGQGMVFAVNCGPEDAPNSFHNFRNAALEVGKQLQAEAEAEAPPAPVEHTTAAYGGLTIPAAPTPTLITQVITLSTSTWTTTYSSYPGSPAATPATLEGEVHRVIVGGESGLVFDPPFVSALPRDTIVFEFRQSSFEDPCRRLEGGFDSDFQFVAADATEFPTWNYTVTDTAPKWAYCRQRTPTSHCGAGMVFAINSDESSGRSFAAFQNVAETLNGTAVPSTSDEGSDDADDDGSAMALGASKIGFTAVLGLVVAALF
ncbi:hypothetical protein CC1G_03632 [Coprinopsis cinerea okayama7|uniref:Cupredoxin n=1 Tax=Coprinopsis cinerea (strain Okayama-7 / 130 / ATCC MYA-4618 / FGSC 9003) TaxID=240176 RepID=A8N1T9_COPC7|nr:hypothetical protein CC1G_03632 [Coprinopsis cinerea okayama7\|eukprot:XP_001828838.2 hypothetical protein CC1G_03632 [Coprinopsis cinerea okayama7\